MSLPSWTMSVHHDSSPYYVRGGQHWHVGETVTIRLRIAPDAPVQHVFLRTTPDGEQHLEPMTCTHRDTSAAWWETAMPLSMPSTAYRFLLHASDGLWWYNAHHISHHTPTDNADFRILADYHAPLWVHEAVFYQIFPDRFADGDPSSNVRTGEYIYYGHDVVASQWGEIPHRGGREFFGGDLQGIIDHLDYLQELGVTGIYLNPIFTSPSNHKYDVADYMAVDPHFGGNAALARLREELDKRHMRLLLDIVPNHCSSRHPWFLAAQADPDAPTAEFFTFHARPDDYECWLGVKSLPKLNYQSERLREIMYGGEDSVMRHWLKPPFRVDGWRIDVANMLARQGQAQLGHKVGRGIRRAVKETNPEAYLIGENFFDGSEHLQGRELDGIMNYRGFLMPLQRWLIGYDNDFAHHFTDMPLLPSDALVEQWRTFLSVIPWQIALQQFNLLDSHDTHRILTVLNGDTACMRIAAALLFTFPGVPCVYYGDEIGMEGGRDPDNRRTMDWNQEHWNMGLLSWFRTLIHLRRSSPALQHGGFQPIYAENDTIAYLRESVDERLLIIARRQDDGLRTLPVSHGAMADRTMLREVVTGLEVTVEDGAIDLGQLPPVGVRIYRIVQ